MFRQNTSETIGCVIDESSFSTVVIHLEKSRWESQRLGNLLPKVTTTTQPRVVMDLSRVERMTTAAIAQLLLLKGTLLQAGRQMYLRGVQSQPRELCSLLKLTGILLGKAVPS